MSYNGPSYLGPRYFGPRYFGSAGGVDAPVTPAVSWGEILKAFRIKALAGDFASAFGVRLYIMQAPPAAVLPYGVVTPIDMVPYSTFSKDGGLLRLQVALYAADDAGGIILSQYAAFLRTNLSRAAMPVSGFEVLGVDYDIERGPFRDGDRWRYDADYIIRFLEN